MLMNNIMVTICERYWLLKNKTIQKLQVQELNLQPIIFHELGVIGSGSIAITSLAKNHI